MGETPSELPPEVTGEEEKAPNLKTFTDSRGGVHSYDADVPGARQKLIDDLREGEK